MNRPHTYTELGRCDEQGEISLTKVDRCNAIVGEFGEVIFLGFFVLPTESFREHLCLCIAVDMNICINKYIFMCVYRCIDVYR